MRATTAVAAILTVLLLAASSSAQTPPTSATPTPTRTTASADLENACCQITMIDARARRVTAVDLATRRIIQFEVPDETMLSTLEPGQKVRADFSANSVSIDGSRMCCVIAVIPRFHVLCGGDCVLDRSTGYIWESTPIPTAESLSQAVNHCSSLNAIHPPSSLTSDSLALQRGWSLPWIWELGTLPDPTLPGSSVPPNTFFNVQNALYWGIGGNPGGHSEVLARVFGTPFGGVGVVQSQSVNLMVWCVVSPWTTGTIIINH